MSLKKKTQNQLICELYVKNRRYDSLREFKSSQGNLTKKEKYFIIKDLIENEN